ncbi:helix-turn-helix transcriptional regulator [Mycolicibacterium brisbanense]|uniref:Response regulator containing a CheY-like receiver domain and an HTH DNA-binding domain n=1 Tax=Mycolicibacterium brisbanense TaxID=146020 RepID=A0A117I4S9_9MYCO|nr:helix-turn-helix transcriptional regulator [Mycolicibacterium brisbanense]MCV7161589.1 helix-turn-helix transcriptional regulator [Mycolicibacterium brisbanense]GAS87437.1 response regulator containing a CheY-like receiver domain and an HTH DNA-binding domain [Mycolicibacterium brisbanense]
MASTYAAMLDSDASIEDRASEVLDALGKRVASSASAICLWDPIQHRHLSIANHGYPNEVMDHFNTWFVEHDPLFDAMRRRSLGALRWRDFPAYRTTYSVTGVFAPAGFDEGLSARLVTAEGNYAGTIHVNCDDPRYPSDNDVDEINMLRLQMAEHLDLSVRPRMVAELMGPEAQAWAVDRTGRAHLLRLGGQWDAPIDEALVGEMAAATVGGTTTRWHDGTGWLHVRHIGTAPRFPQDSLHAVMLITRSALPFGITPRELDALTLAARGLTNNQIATQLFISVRTAGHHLESATAKLGASNRASCVSQAMSWGLLSGRMLRDLDTHGVASG